MIYIIITSFLYILFIWALIKYFPGKLKKVDRCRKNDCGYFTPDKCGNPTLNLSREEFTKRRGKTYYEYSGKPGKWPCSTKYIGFDNPYDHERHISNLRRLRFTFIVTIAVSVFFGLSGLLWQIYKTEELGKRVLIIEKKLGIK